MKTLRPLLSLAALILGIACLPDQAQVPYYPATGSAGAVTLIQEQVLGTAAASVTFSGIPQNFKSLKLIYSAQSGGSGNAFLIINFNGDAGANYTQMGSYSGNGTYTASYFTAVTAGTLGIYGGTGTGGGGEYTFVNYATAIPKIMTGFSAGLQGTTYIQANNATLWTGTAAITSIVITPPSATILAGSTFTLLGIS